MQGRRPNDSSIFLERAYVDWTVLDGNVPLTLTIGRQPSSDGPSHQFKDNTVRKATYSALSFDGAADGIVATLGLAATGIPRITSYNVCYTKLLRISSAMLAVADPNAMLTSFV